MQQHLYFLAALSFAAAAQAASAEPSADRGGQPASPAPNNDKNAIVVNGRRQGDRVLIDRRSYDIGRDVQSSTGSVADVLRNLPSVDVDLQGNVTLRGQGNVTVLVDGKPSGQFRGSGAQMLQQIPASRFERIEVVTNPSAAFASDGSGGIINLITKRNRTPGLAGSVSGSADVNGRRNAAASLSRGVGSFTLSGDVSARRELEPFTRKEEFDLGALGGGSELTRGKGVYDSRSADAGVQYKLDPARRLDVDVRYSRLAADTRSRREIFRTEDEAPPQQVTRNDKDIFTHQDREADVSYRQEPPNSGNQLVIDLIHERVTDDAQTQSNPDGAAPAGGPAFENFGSFTKSNRDDLKADYTRQIRSQAKLAVGMEARVDRDLLLRSGGTGDSQADADQPNPLFADRFAVSQTILSAYATYEQPIGKVDAQLGTRIEWTHLGLRGSASDLPAVSYLRVLPSLNLADELNAHDTIRGAFTERVERPGAGQLDPFPVFVDSRHFTAGNSHLTPAGSTSAELSFDHSKGENSYSATVYYHDHRNIASDVVTDLGGGVLLTSQQNVAFSRAIGAEFSLNDHLSRNISVRLSGNVYRQDLAAAAATHDQNVSATVLSGKASLDWQLDPATLLQLHSVLVGKQLLPQGFLDPIGYLGFGLRHQFGSRLWGVLSVQDAFASYRSHRVTQTAGLRDVVDRMPSFRTIFFGLTYSLSGGRAHEPELKRYALGQLESRREGAQRAAGRRNHP